MSLNRTFVELKLNTDTTHAGVRGVLIEPLWN